MLKISRLFVLGMMFAALGCGSGDEMGRMADAGSRATGGDASGRSGSIDSDVVGGYMPGDINKIDVQPQRNTTATAAGDNFSGVTVNAAGGAAAVREAMAADPLLRSYQREIDELSETTAESRPTERIDALRSAIAARAKEIEQAAARSAPTITVTGNTMVVVAPRVVGKDPPATTEADASLAKEIVPVIEAAKPKQ